MDLQWEMAMLTFRARRFIKRIGRKLDVNGQRVGFDRGREINRRIVIVETPTENALVAQDGIGGYDWSYQAEEEHPTNFALMAHTSSGSSSSSDSEVDSCSKSCVKAYATLKEQYDSLSSDYKRSQFNLVSYKAGLESVEARLAHYKKNKAVFEESINVLNLEVKLRDNALVENKKKLEKAEKERDELKLTLEKFQNSSKSLNNLLESQVIDKLKTRLGYNAASSTAASPAVESFVNSSEMLENHEYNKSKSDKGYHAVPPPYTGNFIPYKPDLTFIDEIVESENMDVITIVTPSNVKKVESNHESADVKNNGDAVEFIPNVKDKTVRPSTEKIKFVKSARETVEKVIRLVWNNSSRVNHKNFANKMTHPHPNRRFVPQAVLTRSGKINTAGASVNTAVRPVNTAGSKTTVNHPRPISNAYKKGYSQVTRPFNKHMTGNKCYLTEYEDYDGGFVSFGDGKGRISGKGKIKTGTLDFDNVYFCKELKYNLFSVSQICDKKNNVLFTDTECLVLSSDFKLLDESQVLLRVPRKDNIYSVDLKSVVPTKGLTCLFAKATIDESNLWHRRLGHINFKNMNKLVRGNLVRGLPSKIFENDHSCVACQKGKQHKASCKAKLVNSISKPLHMLHMDLFGPTNVKSLMKKSYCLVVTDDFSRFYWVFFLATKDETSGILKTFITEIENQLDYKVKVIRSDNGTEFKNSVMNQFCEIKGIKREFSVARTPQQNGVAERRNRTLIEAARNIVLVIKPHKKTPYELIHGRTLLIDFMKPFGCHVTILNTRDHLGKFDGKADEGFFVGYSVVSKAMRVFNKRTRIVEETLNIRFLENAPNVTGNGPDWLFDVDSLTISMNYVPVVAGKKTNDIAGTRDYINWMNVELFDKMGRMIKHKNTPVSAAGPSFTNDDPSSPVNAAEASNAFEEHLFERFSPFKNAFTLPPVSNVTLMDDTGIFGNAYDDEDVGADADLNNLETTMNVSPIPTTRIDKDHPKDQIIRDFNSAIQTRRMTKISDEHAMKVWTLVNLPNGKRAIGTKWVFRNKKDERGIVVRNKARLVAQGYTQEEGIDYDEVFAPVARIEAIRLFLAYASFMGFIVYQMDVKSAFLYGTIDEEVYVCQPPSFEDPQFPDKVYKVEKALYGLHQAPRAWYETLSTYLIENGFRRGTIDKTLFIKKDKGDILLVHVYVDDIIFGSTKKSLCDEFEGLMHKRFQMSYMGELTFFLGLQVQQKKDGIFISQDKYVANILKKFDFATVKTSSTPTEPNKELVKDEEADSVDVHLYRSMIGSLMYLTASRPDIMIAVCACAWFQVTPKRSHLHAVKRIFRYLKGQPKLGLWYPRDSPFDLEAFSDSDYARASLDRKSTIGGCQFLGKRLISWQCKKQTIVANSTTEAEYVAAANCCGQVLWIQNQMLDYGFNFMNTKIFIDNESTICIVKNPVFHSKTKHIEIRHHFIRDCYEKKLIQVIKIHTDHNVADLLTKAFDGQDNPLIPNPHPHLLNSTIKKPIIVPPSYQPKKTHKPRKAIRITEISQSSGPINLVADETVYKEWEDRIERATTTASSLDAEQDSDAQTRFEIASKQSNNPPLSRGYTLRSREDSMKLLELMELYIKLSDLFWATAKVKTVNGERQRKCKCYDCCRTVTIFEELARMGAKTTAWNKFSSTMASAIICLAINQKFNMSKYIFNAMVKHLEGGVKFMTDSTDDVPNEESVPTHSDDPLLSGEDRLKLTDLMDMCSKLSERVLDLEHTKTAQAQEITKLKQRVKKLEKKAGLRTHKFKRLYKVGVTRRVEYSDNESLGAQKDASNQGRSIEDINKDAKVSLVDETQGRSYDVEMFDTDALIGNEVFAEDDMIEKNQDVILKEVSTAAPYTTVMPPPDITKVEITLAQTLAKLKSAKSKVVIQEPVQSTTTTAPSTIPKAKGITFRDVGESTTRTPTLVSSSSIKDKGRAKMDEPEVPLKKKDQIAFDEEMARNLKAQIQVELIEEERLARKK
ncbi:retrovirus-related pol polyprotein from transposon TNT 1-94 [Tanacetum coccineum]